MRGCVGRPLPEQAFREAAAQPATIGVDAFRCRFADVERRNFERGNAAGERFRRLPHQLDSGGAEQQKVPVAFAGGTAFVDDPAQDFKKARQAMDFVDHHQLALLLT